jgi:hypothetical protein
MDLKGKKSFILVLKIVKVIFMTNSKTFIQKTQELIVLSLLKKMKCTLCVFIPNTPAKKQSSKWRLDGGKSK